MAECRLKVGDLVCFDDDDFLLGVITEVYYRSKDLKVIEVEVFKVDGKFGTYDGDMIKRYTLDRSLNKVIISLLNTLENSEEWIDHKSAVDYFMESMNEENKEKVGD